MFNTCITNSQTQTDYIWPTDFWKLEEKDITFDLWLTAKPSFTIEQSLDLKWDDVPKIDTSEYKCIIDNAVVAAAAVAVVSGGSWVAAADDNDDGVGSGGGGCGRANDDVSDYNN